MQGHSPLGAVEGLEEALELKQRPQLMKRSEAHFTTGHEDLGLGANGRIVSHDFGTATAKSHSRRCCRQLCHSVQSVGYETEREVCLVKSTALRQHSPL